MKKYSLLILLAVTTTFASAQGTITKAHHSNFKTWTVGLSLGSLYMAGDHSSFDPDNGLDFNLGLNLHGTRFLNSAFGIRADLTLPLGGIQGSNGVSRFETTSYIDYTISAVGNLSALGVRGRRFDRKSTFLVIGGFGASHSKAERYVRDVLVETWPSEFSESSYTTEMFVKGAGMLKYKINNSWDFDLGLEARFFLGDAVDALVGSRSTNKGDILIYPHLGVSYNFGKGKKDEVHIMYTNPLDDIFADVEEVKNNFDKLTTDDDKDGVNNFFDQENNTPEGVVVDGSGKASDVDGDGIPDYMDEDPFTAKGAKVSANGRALDSDGDGVADHLDKEPNTPAGTLVNFKGVTLPKGNGGGGVGSYLPSVYFAFNSASVSAANQQRLATIAMTMKRNADIKVTITGHADSRGSEEYNKNLSMRRAQAVIKQLVQVYGIDESRLTAEASGSAAPLAKGNYSINRRADVTVK